MIHTKPRKQYTPEFKAQANRYGAAHLLALRVGCLVLELRQVAFFVQ